MRVLNRIAISPGVKRRILQQRLILRALWQRSSLTSVINRTRAIGRDDLLAFATIRNEQVRLPCFLSYYRKLGIRHFLIVDNDSTDGSQDYLRGQDDVSLWHTKDSYRQARFGMDWINWLLARHGHNHWCLTVDPDELLVYPHCDSRPLKALTDWLDSAGRHSFPAMLLDLYGKPPVDTDVHRSEGDPFAQDCWFDPANYMLNRDPLFGNLWIQGGPRARSFFQDQPLAAPALNKIPLVRWRRSYTYVSSTHMLLPRRLNQIYCRLGGEMESGCLLHTKLLTGFGTKFAEEVHRGQHYAGGREYRAYHGRSGQGLTIWSQHSREYADWRQLEDLGLISRGNWV
jgi:hypothetical protein